MKGKTWMLNRSLTPRPGRGIAGMGEIAVQALSIPSALIAEGYEAYTGKGDGKFNFKDAMPKYGGVFRDTGTQKEIGNIMYPNASGVKQQAVTLATDPTTLLGGGAAAKSGGKLIKKGITKSTKQIKKLGKMNKIGKFNMPHSPLNKVNKEVNKDSIASAKAWKEHKADYLKKEGGQKEYDMEKGEFYYSPKHKKLRLIPTDDGEVQDKSGIKDWQLAPNRQSSQEEEVYNMTPDATAEESKAVRDKFDNTYMKGNKEPYPGYFKEKSDRAKKIESEYGDVMGEGGKSLINKPWKLLTSNKYNYPRWEGRMMDAGVELGKNLLIPGRLAKKAKKAWDLKQINKNKNIY